jgi:hypothetical protein
VANEQSNVRINVYLQQFECIFGECAFKNST